MISSILRILALVRKELLAVLKDPRGRFSILVPPMLQCLLFGYAATFDLNDVTCAVLDQDRSPASQELLATLDGSRAFRRVASLQRAADVNRAIDERRALLVIWIGSGFQRKLSSGQPVDVQVVADGRNSNTAGIALGYVSEIVETFNSRWRAAHGMTGRTIRVSTRTWYNPNLESRWNMIPALIGTLTMLQTLLLTAMSVAREREQGTFDQLLVAPFRPAEIMAGKALPSMIIGAVQATSILLIAQLWFRIPFAGSLAALYVGLILFLLAAVGAGLLISAFAATMQQAMLYTFVLVMPFTLLSGLATPISSMPTVLQYVTLFNPLRYAIQIAQRVYLEGAALDLLLPNLWPLAAMAVVSLSVAALMFRHRLE
ncbi:MAG TPA: ABC transporter permease [Phycisphaerae bacterium]|nr:ABC transporter permease [Phycisphaerae bacterium]HRY70845.1 ABC transporter permease [Phycisphaerae bacterium]HSA28552.1 ABC transporter permease [Phycisphaerae bacterium]